MLAKYLLLGISFVFSFICILPAIGQEVVSRYETSTKHSKIKVGVLAKTKKSTISYPEALLGNWGGRLKIYRYDASALYRKLDLKLVTKSIEHLQPGRTCSLNFMFEKSEDGSIQLKVSNGIIMIPAMSSAAFKTAMKTKFRDLSSKQVAFIESQMSQKKTPIQINFGEFQTSSDRVGITGNHNKSNLVEKSVIALDDGVFEERLVLTNSVHSKDANLVSNRLEESIFWIKMIPNKDYIYVRICALEGTGTGRLLSRLVLAGHLVKGKKVLTDMNIILKQSLHI